MQYLLLAKRNLQQRLGWRKCWKTPWSKRRNKLLKESFCKYVKAKAQWAFRTCAKGWLTNLWVQKAADIGDAKTIQCNFKTDIELNITKLSTLKSECGEQNKK